MLSHYVVHGVRTQPRMCAVLDIAFYDYSVEPNQAGSCLNKQVVFSVSHSSLCDNDAITCSAVGEWNPVDSVPCSSALKYASAWKRAELPWF